MKWIICFFLLLSGEANADNWSTADTWRETSWQAINVIDWGQTLDIVEKRNKGLYETNPILGKNPSRGDVNLYFASSALIHYGISKWFPSSMRSPWQYFTIGFSAGTVWNNYRLGYRVHF